MNPNFVFQQIRRYNTATSQLYKDAALTAVGTHVGLLEKKNIVARELTNEERKRILYYLDMFCKSEGITVNFKR